MDESQQDGLKTDAVSKLNEFAREVQSFADEMEAEQADKPQFARAFRAMFYKVIATLIFDYGEGKLKIREAEERNAVIALMKLGKTYAEEMQKCNDANARLSGLAMACSLLETMLMIACITGKERVFATKQWQKVWKKAKRPSFLMTLQDRNMNISILIEIGQELNWFHKALPVEFTNDLTPDELQALLAKVPEQAKAAVVAPNVAKNVRNMLHPGKCLRENLDFESGDALETGVMFMALAICAFVMGHAA